MDYNKQLSQTILKKLIDINNGDFDSYYQYDEKYELATLLAFFALFEERIVTIDKDDYLIVTRYSTPLSHNSIDHLFNFSNSITYIDKEPNGDKLWFLATLRNSLLHNGIDNINFKNRTIEISDTHFLNHLHCIVPFEFFSHFISCNFQQEYRFHKRLDRIFNFSEYLYVNEYIEQNGITKLSRDDIQKCIELIRPTIIKIKDSTDSTVEDIDNHLADTVLKTMDEVTRYHFPKNYEHKAVKSYYDTSLFI